MKQAKVYRETQIRIVLNPKYKPKADEVLAATGLDNLSQLFSVLLVNYGDRLIAAFKAEQSLNEPLEVLNSDTFTSIGGLR